MQNTDLLALIPNQWQPVMLANYNLYKEYSYCPNVYENIYHVFAQVT